MLGGDLPVLKALKSLTPEKNLRLAYMSGAACMASALSAAATGHGLPVTLAVGTFAVALGFGVRASVQRWSHAGALSRLGEAIEPMAEGIAFFDAEDRAIVWNSRYADLVDPAGSLTPGQSFHDLMRANIAAGAHPAAIGREDEWLAERLASRHRLGSDEHKNGERWVRATRRRSRDGGIVTVCVDVTEFRRAEETLEHARDAAETANKAKSEFLANISHELRTPLNGVLGIAEVLARTPLTDKQKEMVETIRSSGASLDALVSDLIDLARLESGKIAAQTETFSVAQAIKTAANTYRIQAKRKKIAFVVDIAPDADAPVIGDATRLRQILANLFSNAVKFTDQGEVRITVDRPEAGGESVRFTVSDTGCGFDARQKDKIFQRFQQADGSSTRRHGGTGLGLAISKQAAGLLGGELDCDSTLGVGSSFVLTLKMPPAEAPAVAEPASPLSVVAAADPDEHGHVLRVLVVDDHPTNRRVVEMILDQVGAERVSVENGQEALEAYLNDRFDVVLMDIQMPVMDGLTAIRSIRLHERESDKRATPVVILSANSMPEHVEAGKAAGADRHLAKPISAAALLRVLAEVANDGSEEAAA